MKMSISSFIALIIIYFSFHAQAEETIKIAGIFAKTGDASKSHLEQMRGAQFAVEELNQKGGILGKQIEWLEFDNQSTALGSKLVAQRAVKAGVIAVIGAPWSSHSLAMAPVLQEAKIPMIATAATNPKVTEVGDYIFRACFIDPFQGTVMANFSKNHLHAKTAVVLTKASAYSEGLSRSFIEHFQKLGGQIVWQGDYLQEDTDFSNLLNGVKQHAPDVVFLPGNARDVAFIITQAYKLGITIPFLGGDGWSNRMFDYAKPEILAGHYYSAHWSRDIPTSRSQDFVKRYEAAKGQLRIDGIALAFDAVMLLANAMERANSWKPEKVRHALANTKNFPAITGDIMFNDQRNPIKSAVIFQFEGQTSRYFKSIAP